MNYFSSIPRWVVIMSISLLAVIFLATVSFVFLSSGYNNRIYPGIKVAGMNMSGLTASEAREKIEKKISDFDSGLQITFQDKTISIGGHTFATNPEIVNPIVIFDPDSTVEHALAVGRHGTFITKVVDQLKARFNSQDIPLAVFVDRFRVTEELKNNFSVLEKPSANAHLVFNNTNDIEIVDGTIGVELDYEATLTTIVSHLEYGDASHIIINAKTTYPEVMTAQVAEIKDQVNQFLALPPLTLTADKKDWIVTPATMKSWLELRKIGAVTQVSFSQTAIKDYIKKNIVPELEVEARPPRLEITNGRAAIWQSGQDGIKIDNEATSKAIMEWSRSYSHQIENKLAIITQVTINSEVNKDAENLGLKEIIGTGVSNFSGSPKNRRHNIKTGAMALHGLLIKPGEEFSLLKALGEIDAQSGYLPELVIKENKTTPEYGGGLCQIGTTMFRATFNSGLPITQRRNHSYRVVYYEPAGTDATIYDPAPDFRFINDTGHYILIQARISENDLAFDFWGTKDGRMAEASKPVIYNIVQPLPTKTVETTDLAPGEKKCTEKAHAGADAYFDYKVTYSNGEIKEKRFSSHYVPWQAVCLIGVKELTPTPSEPLFPTGTITPLITPSTIQ